MILDNVKELLIAQEIISEVDLAFYDQERVNLSESLKKMLAKNKTFLDKIKKYEKNVDIMLEAKAKDEAMFKLIRQIKYQRNYSFIDETSFIISE